jgi:hypothetical protein
MTIHDLVETLLEMVADGVSRDTEVCISHEFDGVKLVESIYDTEVSEGKRKDVVLLLGNGEYITIQR